MNSQHTFQIGVFSHTNNEEIQYFLARIVGPGGNIVINILEIIINGVVYVIYDSIDNWRESILLLANLGNPDFYKPFIIYRESDNIPLIYSLI